jgi:hypothetical protein
MSIFNFLKSKKNQELSFLKSNPEFYKGVYEAAFSALEIKATNLIALGRQDEARKVAAEFLGKYATEGPCEVASANELPVIYYDLAFYNISFLVHRNWAEFIARWNSAVPFQVFLAIISMTKHNKRMPLDDIFEFKLFMGKLTDGIKYYLLQFPNLIRMSVDASKNTPNQHKADSGPYYLVVTHNEISDEKRVYILTRLSDDSTMLHYNSPTKMSICGIGSKPEPRAFLDCVSAHIFSN